MDRQHRRVPASWRRFEALGTAWGLMARALRRVLPLALRGAIRAYQLFLSPVLPPSCRFLPTCSDYAIEAVERHGAVRGVGLALRRLMRCHPWGGSGYDPVPPVGHRRPGCGSRMA